MKQFLDRDKERKGVILMSIYSSKSFSGHTGRLGLHLKHDSHGRNILVCKAQSNIALLTGISCEYVVAKQTLQASVR